MRMLVGTEMVDNHSRGTRGVRGGGVVIASQLVRTVVQLLGALLLSRLLTPADFGLMAMATVLLIFADLVRDFGLSTAGLQARSLSSQQASNLFWANAGLGLALYVVVVVLTPLAALVYDEQRMWVILPTTGLALLLGGLQTQFQVQLTRDQKYRSLASTEIASAVLGLGSALAVAYAGGGYWALIAQSVVGAISLTLLRVLCARWLPQRPRRGHGSSLLFRIGAHLGLANVLAFLQGNADTVTLGVQYGPTVTGYYSRAFQLLTLPTNAVLGPLSNVVVSVVRGDSGDAIAAMLLRIQYALATLTVGYFVIAASTAEHLIPVLIGNQWQASVPFFQILSIAGAVQALSQVNYWRFVLSGQTRALLRYNMISKPVVVVAIVTCSLYSPTAVAWAYSIGMLLSWPLALVWISRVTRTSSWPFFWHGSATIVSGCFAYAIVRLWFSVYSDASLWGGLLSGLLIAVCVYLIALLAIPLTRRAILDSVSLAMKLRPREGSL
ncbi:oligosaccharide flippase family protein [Microbacterium testaceum]|uniref:oligosaccharide flippase family protein n=1 Tax=Microbacterium testaceum TaxID=2033 RepID=UPI001D17D213|nr:oligosaccharide flippase family protein [Microbacterium testaceum]MCC4249435.1 oligosaccharide flippase family protein [Microbacterium testaceum]